MLWFCFPPTDADLRPLITAEGTAHDPAHGPIRHVCLNHVSILFTVKNEIEIVIKSSHMLCHWSGLDHLQKLSFMKHTHGICDKNQVWHLISYPVVFSQVTTEQREKSQ